MTRGGRRTRNAAICGLAVALLAGSARTRGSEARATTVGEVFACNNYSPMVADLDATIRFYHGVLGVPLVDPAPTTFVAWDTESWRRDLHGLQGSPMRFATLRVPSADPHEAQLGLEFVEQGAIGRHAVTPRPQDPGAATLVLFVRDIDTAFARVLESHAPIVTAGGRPIALHGDVARAVVVRDPDNHFVELAQPAIVRVASGNLLGARLRLTIASTEPTLHLYRDLFGLPFDEHDWDGDPAVGRLIGAPGARVRVSVTRIPHVFASPSTLHLEFVEMRCVDRKAVRPRIEDPGATRFQMRVRHIADALADLTQSGPSTVISNTGRILPDGTWEKGVIDRTTVRHVTVSDLNGYFLVLNDYPAGSPLGPPSPVQ